MNFRQVIVLLAAYVGHTSTDCHHPTNYNRGKHPVSKCIVATGTQNVLVGRPGKAPEGDTVIQGGEGCVSADCEGEALAAIMCFGL